MAENLKLGIADYDSEIEKSYGAKKVVPDAETQSYCFTLCSLFFLDFISAWFEYYSKCFAGNRHEQVSSAPERLVQRLYEIKIVTLIVGMLAVSFLLGQYMRFTHSEFMGLKVHLMHYTGGLLYLPGAFSLGFRSVISVVELKQGMVRIVDFDVEDKR